MDPIVSRSADLLPPVTIDPRIHGCKPHHNDIIHGPDNGEAQVMLNTQYINLPRLPDNLSKVQLDTLPNDLLGHHVVDIPPSGGMVPTNNATGYYGEDLLGNDLTEEDKRLAAALVAVQLVHQQKQNPLLPAELLNTKTMTPLSPFTSTSIEKPGMAAMVSSYIQAFEDESTAHLLDPPQPATAPQPAMQERKSFSSQPLPDIRLPPLPPLKKVISTQNLLKNKSKKTYLDQHLDSESVKDCVVDNLKLPKIDDMDTSMEDHCLDDMDSDYEIDSELKPSRRSLPHKKRIPKKLKTQPQRNIHSKCYKCQKCGDSFSSQTSFFNHRSQHTNPLKRSNIFSCEICQFQSPMQMQFFEHLKTHYEPKNAVESVIQTDLQDFNDSNMPDVVDSFEMKEENNESNKKNMLFSITCEQCGKIFRRQRMYEAHKATAHPPTMEEFSEPEDMMEGIRHVVNIQATCPDEENDEKQIRAWKDLTCVQSDVSVSAPEKSCIQSDSFEESTNSSPTKKKAKKKELACPHCPRIFIHRTSLLYHVRSHTGRRPHQCEVCGKSFFAKNALKVHMRMHSGDKPYKCETCGRCFRQWGDLKYHVTSLHSTQKQYQCEFCGKDFARKYSLIVHRRIHTNEKNYVCEFCCKTFRASSYLLNHRRIHTGEKPHSCDICHKPFRMKSDLKRHRATHNKVRANPSSVVVVTDHQAAATAAMVVSNHQPSPIEHRPEHQPLMTTPEPECILPDVSTAPLNLMRSDATDGLAYTRGITLERDQNTVYVWLPTGAESILPD